MYLAGECTHQRWYMMLQSTQNTSMPLRERECVMSISLVNEVMRGGI
jgi:hypothetical protein